MDWNRNNCYIINTVGRWPVRTFSCNTNERALHFYFLSIIRPIVYVCMCVRVPIGRRSPAVRSHLLRYYGRACDVGERKKTSSRPYKPNRFTPRPYIYKLVYTLTESRTKITPHIPSPSQPRLANATYRRRRDPLANVLNFPSNVLCDGI